MIRQISQNFSNKSTPNCMDKPMIGGGNGLGNNFENSNHH